MAFIHFISTILVYKSVSWELKRKIIKFILLLRTGAYSTNDYYTYLYLCICIIVAKYAIFFVPSYQKLVGS